MLAPNLALSGFFEHCHDRTIVNVGNRTARRAGKFANFELEIVKAPRLSEENSIAYPQNSLVAQSRENLRLIREPEAGNSEPYPNNGSRVWRHTECFNAFIVAPGFGVGFVMGLPPLSTISFKAAIALGKPELVTRRPSSHDMHLNLN